MLLILGLFLFVLLVVIHEYGHFLAAKKNGVDVEEFGIGFPPRIAGKTMGKGIFRSYYSINWLPVGGFVKLKGEHDEDTEPGTYGSVSFGKKTLIIVAGVAMNFLAAALILSVLSATGMPRLVENQFAVAGDTTISKQEVVIGFVEDDSPASSANIEAGDTLVSVAGTPIEQSSELRAITEANAGQTVVVETVKDDVLVAADVTLNADGNEQGFLGVQPSDYIEERSTWSAPIRGFGLAVQYSWLTLQGVVGTFADLLTGNGAQAAENVAGPVGIVVLLRDVSAIGLSALMVFVALISITLAVMNILPIPALDGGRLFVSGLYRLMKKPLSAQTEERIHGTGMLVLLSLVVLITIVDVRRFF